MTRKTTTLMLERAGCIGSSAVSIERVMRQVPGVLRVYVNPATEAAYVEYDADRCAEDDLTRAVTELGIDTHHVVPHSRRTSLPPPTVRRLMPESNSHSRSWWAFAGFVAIAGFLLFTEHRAHVFGALPYLFLLACPFLHMFGHSGHGGHGGQGENANRDTPQQRGGLNGNASHHDHSAPADRRDDKW